MWDLVRYTVYSQQNEQDLGFSVNEIHTLSPTVSSLAGTYNYTAQQAFISTYINYNQIKNSGSTTGFGGNLETELAINRKSILFNGVKRGNASGIIAHAESSNGKDRSSLFALLDANNRKIAIFPVNTKTLFHYLSLVIRTIR